jgi:hypothetical protein
MWPIRAKNTKMKDYTILLQGKINVETFNLWINNHKDSNVVVSIWEDEDLTKFKIPKGWKVIVNEYPIFRFREQANLDYQIITTLKGLHHVNTNWVIKMRCDEYWSNIDKIYTKIKTEPEKLLSGSMYFRKWGLYKFHIGDKILGGTTENLKLMFESTLHNLQINLWDSYNPEGQLGLGYVMAKDSDIQINKLNVDTKMKSITKSSQEIITTINKATDNIVTEMVSMVTRELNYWRPEKVKWKSILDGMLRWRNILNECVNLIDLENSEPIDDKKYLKKWFHIIDISELKPYIATRNFGPKDGGRKWYRNDFDNKKEECLTDINQ